MKTKLPILALAAISAISCISTANTSALTYQSSYENKFEIKTSVSIELSAHELKIDELALGSAADSNEITVTASTNSQYGYIVGATVGDGNTYTNTDLKHKTDTSADAGKFTSLDPTESVTALNSLEAGKWGYAFSRDGGSTWINANKTGSANNAGYSGLPYYSGTPVELINTKSKTASQIKFKIAASSSETQEAGEYNNVINFVVTSVKLVPDKTTIADAKYMQDVEACPADLETEENYTLTDKRDGKTYTVAKLKDGKCWMTSNLALAGGTELYSETSNVPEGYPESGGTPYYTLPASSARFYNDSVAYMYNGSSSNSYRAYYSWLAATAGGKDANGADVTGNGSDTAYSVCPKGWRLPTSGDHTDSSATSATGYKKGDFYKLAIAYGANLESNYYQNSSTFYDNAGPGTVPNFLLGGHYYYSLSENVGSVGCYLSATSSSSSRGYRLDFSSSYVGSASSGGHYYGGFSVRCLLAD